MLACGDDGGGDGTNPGADAGPDAGDTDAGVQPIGDDDEPVSGATVEACEVELPAPTDGACSVAEGSSGAVMIQGDVLVGETVYQNGAVVYEGDTIVCVGCDCAGDEAYAEATRVACPGAAVSPGLINAHDHLTFNEGHPIDHGDTRYEHRHEWRAVLSAPGNAHGSGAESSGNRWGELRHTLAGATSLFGSGAASGGLRNLDRLENAEETRGFVELDNQTFPLGDGDAKEMPEAPPPENCDWNYRRDELDVYEENAYLPHVAEGIDFYAAEEFRCQSQSIDGARDFTEANTSHIHSIALSPGDYWNMARDQAKLIWSPRSNISLYGFTAGVQVFDALGGVVALGTDWSYSGSANMLRELACADQYNDLHLDDHFTDVQLWKMATINAAQATGAAELVGSLEVGKVADIAVFATEGATQHRAVLEADNGAVALVIQDGEVMTGERATVEALAAQAEDCEVIDVCGSEHAVCAMREYGTTFAAVADDVATGDRPAYPAIFCGVPEGEPTCVPSRPGEFTGFGTTADFDGDGVGDDVDNCPRVFNPARPIDDGAQPDLDGDGQGDACDDEPLDPDLDGDGVSNLEDNCPFHGNEDQADADADDKGAFCDPCDDRPNPSTVCPPLPPVDTTIEAIQMEEFAVDTNVAVSNVVVTATYNLGLWVQDPAAATPDYSGIYVFTGSGHGAAVGDLVDVSGTYIEYFGDSEIADAEVTVLGSGAPIVPTVLSTAEAATEAYEGVLVTIDGEVTANPHDCSTDNDNCRDENLYEIDDLILVYDRTYQDDDWANHMGESPVTGVMSWRFERRRIQPRTAADFPPAI